MLSIGNAAHPSDVQATVELVRKYDLPLHSLLASIFDDRIVSKHAFDRMLRERLKVAVLCVDSLYVGHAPTGFLRDDFITRTGVVGGGGRGRLKQEQLGFKGFLLSFLGQGRWSGKKVEVPTYQDGLLFLIRRHNRYGEGVCCVFVGVFCCCVC